MRYCEHCGKQIQEGIKFCPYCGHKVSLGEDLEKRVATPHKTESVKQTQINQSTGFQEIQEISVLEKWGTSQIINRLVKIYTVIVLVIAAILYGLYKTANSWGESFLDSNSGSQNVKSLLQALQIVPPIYYALIIFAVVILVLSIYRFLRNFKGKVHLIYSVGLGISIYELYHFRDLIDAIHEAGKYTSGSNGLEYFFTSGFTNAISIASRIMQEASTYKSTTIILLLVTAALFVISILSKLQFNNKVTVGSWISMEGTGDPSGKTLDFAYLKKAIHTPKAKKLGIVVIILALCFGGFTVWNKYLNFTSVDALKNVKLEYDGISGEATADIASNQSTYKGDDTKIKNFLSNQVSYSLSKDSEISNGDTITVKAEYNKEQANEIKLKLKDTTKMIKVSGLEHRFHKASEIPTKISTELRSDADEEVESAYEDTDYVTYTNKEFVNSWFIKNGDSGFGDTSDSYVACYKISQTEKSFWDGSQTKSSFFAYVYTDGLTSGYNSDQANWGHTGFGDDITSSNQFQEALASQFDVDEDQVQSMS